MSVDKLVDSTALDAGLTSIANAIRRKTGGSKQLSFPDGFVNEIGDIAATYDKTPIDDVTFVDYDGTVLYTYSADEFMGLTEMPANPSHTGLVAQGWNWTLAGAKEYVGENGCLCIGQNYTTDDGCTRFYATISEDMLGLPSCVNMYTSVKGGVAIDWGDGYTTITDANANTYKSYTHTYESVGNYIIELDCTDGNFSLGYNGSNNGILYNNSINHTITSKAVYKVEIGDNCTVIHRQGFSHGTNIRTISIPSTITYFGSGTYGSVFADCYNLKCVVYPQGTTLGGTNDLSSCYNINFVSYPENVVVNVTNFTTSSGNLRFLRMLTLPRLSGTGTLGYLYQNLEYFSAPGTYTNIAASFCRECYRVNKITIPTTVTNIADYAMTNTALKELHVLPTTPPTVANSRGLPNIVTKNGIVYVPYSSDHSILEAYKTATNWSAYAQYMQEEPQS